MGAEGSFLCAIPTSVHHKDCIKNARDAVSLSTRIQTPRNVRSTPK